MADLLDYDWIIDRLKEEFNIINTRSVDYGNGLVILLENKHEIRFNGLFRLNKKKVEEKLEDFILTIKKKENIHGKEMEV